MSNQAITIPASHRREPDANRETALTRARYDRLARIYDLMQGMMDRGAIGKGRPYLWSHVAGSKLLEVGVGTGKSMDYYPKGSQVTAIDLSERMLERAERRAAELDLDVDLRRMDVQHLDFPDGAFDTIAATCVFCSVPDPVAGLRELKRVVKPGGDIWLLEHVRIDRPVIGPLMDALNPMMVRMMGANINRQTVENVRRAGLQIVSVEDLGGPLVKFIHVRA
jgi:phosphatidylethanolamine/phosphatidyl-N-methylethanolamine N-methyltransferase